MSPSGRRTSSRRLTQALVAAAVIAIAHPWSVAGGQAKPGGEQAKPSAATVRVQPAVAAAKAAVTPGCGAAFTMPNASFHTLEGVRDASVWVDDIDAGLLGGFEPFEVYVVTGKLYAPFQLKVGKLGRDNFRKYTSNNYNTQPQGPLTIADSHPSGQLAFLQDDRRFVLKVTSVQPSTFDRDTITVQLCW